MNINQSNFLYQIFSDSIIIAGSPDEVKGLVSTINTIKNQNEDSSKIIKNSKQSSPNAETISKNFSSAATRENFKSFNESLIRANSFKEQESSEASVTNSFVQNDNSRNLSLNRVASGNQLKATETNNLTQSVSSQSSISPKEATKEKVSPLIRPRISVLNKQMQHSNQAASQPFVEPKSIPLSPSSNGAQNETSSLNKQNTFTETNTPTITARSNVGTEATRSQSATEFPVSNIKMPDNNNNVPPNYPPPPIPSSPVQPQESFLHSYKFKLSSAKEIVLPSASSNDNTADKVQLKTNEKDTISEDTTLSVDSLSEDSLDLHSLDLNSLNRNKEIASNQAPVLTENSAGVSSNELKPHAKNKSIFSRIRSSISNFMQRIWGNKNNKMYINHDEQPRGFYGQKKDTLVAESSSFIVPAKAVQINDAARKKIEADIVDDLITDYNDLNIFLSSKNLPAKTRENLSLIMQNMAMLSFPRPNNKLKPIFRFSILLKDDLLKFKKIIEDLKFDGRLRNTLGFFVDKREYTALMKYLSAMDKAYKLHQKHIDSLLLEK